jgi:hypothetical protein
MTVHPDDHGTLDHLAAAKRGRGRPRKPDALTSAEKQSRYRNGYRTGLNRLAKALAAYDAGEADAVGRLVNQVRALLERTPR